MGLTKGGVCYEDEDEYEINKISNKSKNEKAHRHNTRKNLLMYFPLNIDT